MNTEKIFKRLLQIVFFLSLASPLMVDRRLFFPYITGPSLFFRLTVEILFFAWLIFILLYPQNRPKFNWLAGAFSIYVLALASATFFGVSAYLSFWGDAERMMGLFGLLHFFVLFLVGAGIFKDKKDRNYLLNSFLAISLIVSVYGILQKFGLTSIKPGEERIVATLGNAAVLAAYLIFGLFFCLYLAIRNDKFVWRAIYGLAGLSHLIAILLTGTRGAYLGVALGFLFAFFFIIKGLNNKKMQKGLIGGLIFLVMLFGLLYYFQDKGPIKNNPYLYRVTHLSISDSTVQQRLISWQAGWRGFLEKPLLGWGFENFTAPFNKYFDARYYDFAREEFFDRAHNIVIELLSTAGVIGLLSYLLFLSAIFYYIFKTYRRDKDFIYPGIFGGLLIAYVVQSLFLFDLLAPLLGLMTFLVAVNNFSSASAPADPANQKKPSVKIRPGLVFLAGVIFLAIFYFSLNAFLIRPYRALKDNVAGQFLIGQSFKASAEDYQQGLLYLKKSVSYDTFLDLDIRTAAANTIYNYYLYGGAGESKKYDLDMAIDLHKRNLKYLPDDTYYNYKLAELLDFRYGVDLDERFRNEAKIYAQKAVATSPNRATMYYVLMENLVMAGKFDEAIEVIQKAISLNDRLADSYWELAKAYFQKQDFVKAKEALIKTIGMGYHISEENLDKFFPLFEVTKSKENEIQFLELAVKNGTTNYLYYSTLANLYYQKGEYEKAIGYARQSADLNPATKEKVDKFIESVRKKIIK
jgi:O-antigen ligase